MFNYTDHLGNSRLSYTDADADGNPEIVEENNYYPFGLKHEGYNGLLTMHIDLGDGSSNSVPYKYKYNGKELQDELGLNMYDYGFRDYDPEIGRWAVIDPLAERRYDVTTYNYVQNNPLLRIDPNGLTDFTLNRKTGEVKQVGEASDQPDRILKTNGKGEVKYNKKGEAKVAIGGIEQGILSDGMNLKTNDNVVEVGGKGQPTVNGVESFALRLSDYLGKEVGGSYFSKDGASNTTHMALGRYEGNSEKESKSFGNRGIRSITSSVEEMNRYNVTGFFHTHPSGVNISDSDRLVPSTADVRDRNNLLQTNPNFNFYIITQPQYSDHYPLKVPYKTGF